MEILMYFVILLLKSTLAVKGNELNVERKIGSDIVKGFGICDNTTNVAVSGGCECISSKQTFFKDRRHTQLSCFNDDKLEEITGCFKVLALPTLNAKLYVYPCNKITSIEVWDASENKYGWTSYELSKYIVPSGFYVQINIKERHYDGLLLRAYCGLSCYIMKFAGVRTYPLKTTDITHIPSEPPFTTTPSTIACKDKCIGREKSSDRAFGLGSCDNITNYHEPGGCKCAIYKGTFFLDKQRTSLTCYDSAAISKMAGCFKVLALPTLNARIYVYPCKKIKSIEVWDASENKYGWTSRLSYELSKYIISSGYYIQITIKNRYFDGLLLRVYCGTSCYIIKFEGARTYPLRATGITEQLISPPIASTTLKCQKCIDSNERGSDLVKGFGPCDNTTNYPVPGGCKCAEYNAIFLTDERHTKSKCYSESEINKMTGSFQVSIVDVFNQKVYVRPCRTITNIEAWDVVGDFGIWRNKTAELSPYIYPDGYDCQLAVKDKYFDGLMLRVTCGLQQYILKFRGIRSYPLSTTEIIEKPTTPPTITTTGKSTAPAKVPSTTTIKITTTSSTTTKAKDNESNSSLILPFALGGAAIGLVIIILLAFIIIKWRKKRSLDELIAARNINSEKKTQNTKAPPYHQNLPVNLPPEESYNDVIEPEYQELKIISPKPYYQRLKQGKYKYEEQGEETKPPCYDYVEQKQDVLGDTNGDVLGDTNGYVVTEEELDNTYSNNAYEDIDYEVIDSSVRV